MHKKRQFFALLFIAIAMVVLLFVEGNEAEQKGEKQFFAESGFVFGTTYSIKYEADSALTTVIRDAMQRVDGSLSMFNEQSTISAINRNDTSVVIDSLFVRVFNRSMQISEATHGAFDITVAPLVNAWGFGFKNKMMPTQRQVDSLLQVVGYQKIRLENNKVVKNDQRIMLDCSAIAKGFGCDVVAEALRANGVENYMVEIGGEVAVGGHNASNDAWQIGINKPIDDSLSVRSELEAVAQLSYGGMATSGNYRNFYMHDGKKYAHTIDPKSGRPVQHNLLSATIVAGDCMTADAFATACMVSGLDSALSFCQANNLQGYFIYTDGSADDYKIAMTSGFPVK